MNVEKIKEQVEAYARIAFREENFAQAMTWLPDEACTVMALDVPLHQAVRTLRTTPSHTAAFMCEAYGADREDIIAITIDHPDGVVLGRIEVAKSEPRLGAIEWTTDVVMPTDTVSVRFPPITSNGRLVGIRVTKETNVTTKKEST